jgi:hypothetical protein
MRTILLSTVLLASVSFGQVSFGGHPLGLDPTNHLPVAPLVVMPPVDHEALLARDAERVAAGVKGPFKFGSNHAVDLSLENSGIWNVLSNGDRVWRLSIQCPHAYSVNLEFHDFVVPEGAQVFVYNSEGEVLGGYEAASNPGHTELGVSPLAGDRITIEYVEPVRVAGQGHLRVGQVTHAYRDIFGKSKLLHDSESCNNNVICPEGDPWRDQIRAAAMIFVSGDGLCSGTLLNNCANDGTPYFLTANHCLGNPNNWIFRFNWESPSCGQNLNGPTTNTVSGAALLVHSEESDVALLRLNSPPPANYNVYYSGWDNGTTPATSATCIHHPSGDIKKISFENQAVVSTNYFGVEAWKVTAWDDGTTEGGSSGSGLWDQNKRLVGQLYGGDANCFNNVNDNFGRFSVSYPLLQQWLGTCGEQLDGHDPATTAVAERSAGLDLFISPNPSSGLVNLVLSGLGRGTKDVRVLDGLGRMVAHQILGPGTVRTVLDLSAQQAGSYLVQATDGETRVVQRLVLTR